MEKMIAEPEDDGVDQTAQSLENVKLSKMKRSEIKAFDMIAALLSTCV